MKPVVLSHEAIAAVSFDAMQSQQAQDVARGIMERARQLASQSKHPHLADSLRIETDQRPKGRGEIKVVMDHEDAAAVEFGDSKTERQRILGRAAGVPLW